MFKQKPKKEVTVSKFLDDLPGRGDIIRDPRSYSQKKLQEACNNIKFAASTELDPIENISIQFIFRNFFSIMHQTGLYNPQRKFFHHIASVNRVEIKEYKKLSKEAKAASAKISDFYFYDIHNKYILVRLEHPSFNFDNDALKRTFSDANNNRSLGAIYIANKRPDQEAIDMIREKTNYSNELERFTSPINDQASFNCVSYEASPSAVIYKLVHPDLAKGESAQASVPAELIKTFYGDVAPVC